MLLNEELLVQEFAAEGKLHVEKIEASLLEIEKDQENHSLINPLFRSAHSIKGTAGFFGLHKIIELSHSMENLLGKIRNGEFAITSQMIEALLKANDKLHEMFENITDSKNYDISLEVQNLTQFISQSPSSSQPIKQSVAPGKVVREQSISLTEKSNNDSKKEELAKLCKKGHKLYKLVLKNTGNIAEETSRRFEMMKKIISVGNVINSYIAHGGCNIILFSTVLEKSLVLMTLNVNQADIVQLDHNVEDEELWNVVEGNVAEQNLHIEDKKGENHNQEEASGKKTNADGYEESIRVNVALLNHLVNLSGELVLAKNRLINVLDDHVDMVAGLRSVLQDINGITTELQGQVMRTRMQTVGSLLNAMPRVVRELAKSMGKHVDFHIEGKLVEMDKSIIEGLSDPITHLLRNALSHGIETPEVRKERNKPPIAQIMIKAYYQGGLAIIDITDDGTSINFGRVKEKAIERGLITQEQAQYSSEYELQKLIFLPGFSTADKVTDISGRGVGLDVAKSNIEKLGGTVEVFSTWGKGTTFHLTLPLTLAIIPALTIGISKQIFALPQLSLQEILRIIPGDTTREIEYIQDHMVLRLRGKLIPVIHLTTVLGLPTPAPSQQQIVRVLILKSTVKQFGLIVDEIYDQEDILIKPLPKYLEEMKEYLGLTILGNGKVVMVLDVEGIAAAAKLKLADQYIQGLETKQILNANHTLEGQEFLLFKCSGPETFGLNLAMISRIDELDREKIEVIGKQQYMNFQGKALPLLQLEDYLPVAKKQTKAKKLYVIIPKMVEYPIGIIVEKIQDTVEIDLEINEKEPRVQGLFGSLIWKEKIILVLNLYELFELMDQKYNTNSSSMRIQGNGKSILLVEDAPICMQIEKQYLAWAGYKILTANNGKEGLGIIRKYNIDVILSDLNMPVMDGIEMVKTIRADEQLSSLPVIALTSFIMKQEQGTNLQKAGFDSYVCKFDRTSLLENIVAVQTLRGGREQ